MNKSAAIITLVLLGALHTAAFAEPDKEGWTGEGALSAGMTSGNTDTSDIGLGLNLGRTSGDWTLAGEAVVDYGEIDSVEAKNRTFLALKVDRQLTNRLFSFGRVSHERDKFTGFDSRSFVGGGLGHHILRSDTAKWTVRGGPGVKIDQVRAGTTIGTDALPVIVPGDTVTSFSAIAKSEYAYAFNESVSLSNATDLLYANESTQIGNSLGLTAKLNGHLKARAAFDVRHDTNPPEGFESTDTATKLSLVYGF